MRRGSRPEKIEEWTSRLKRFENSGQTVQQFCKTENIAPASFYQWRTKLNHPTPRPSAAGFEPVHVNWSSATNQETIVRLGRGVEIKLGSDLAIVETVVQQLLAASNEGNSSGADPC